LSPLEGSGTLRPVRYRNFQIRFESFEPVPRLILTVFLPFALAPVVSFLLRMVNAVIAPDLAAEFDLNPANLGLLTSAYFLGFGAAQLPLGLMLDRYGPRRVAAALYMLGATGALIYAFGQNALTLTLGRGLMGIGMSCSVMAGLKAASIWFPAHRLPLINMTLFGMSGVGACWPPYRWPGC
jgi:MFS family permease